MAGGAIYALLLIAQFFGVCGLLIFIGICKYRNYRADREGTRGIALWISFGFTLLAAAFDGMALLAGKTGNLVLVDHRRIVVLVLAGIAFALGVYGRGSLKVTLVAMALTLLVISRVLMFAFLLQFLG